MKHEIRAGKAAEIREENGKIKVSGYAVVFDEIADIGGMFREVIRKGAFKDAVGRDDVVFLVNHEGLPLARTRSGTLKLKEDDHGLKIESELDTRDPDVQQIQVKMERGDLDKMSFAFIPEVQEWDETDENELPLRSVTTAQLFDVSIVNYPAYEGSEIGLRSLQDHRQKNTVITRAAIKARMKMDLALRQMNGQPAR